MEGVTVIQLSPARLTELLRQSSLLGAYEAMKLAGVPVKEAFSKAEMYRKYGRSHINRLIGDGLLTAHKVQGGKPVYLEQEYQSLVK